MGQEIRDINDSDFFQLKSSDEKIKFLLRYAILAPSTHNSQPWLFKIKNNGCEIYNNQEIKIIEADPLGRDLYVSFGCLLENLIIAAEYFGIFKETRYSGDGQDNLIAEIVFKNLDLPSPPASRDKTPSRLLTAIKKRINSRGLFENKEVAAEFVQRINGLNSFPGLELYFVSEKSKIKKLAELTAQGLMAAYQNPKFRQEMSGWMHSSFSKKRDGLPGYSLRMPALISLIFPFLVRRFNMGKRVGKLNYLSASSAPLIAVIGARENSRKNWLDTGRLVERIMLEAQTAGLKTSIFVAAIEIGELYKEVQKVLASDLIPQLLICVGYMNFEQKPSPRHPAESKIIS